MKLAKPLKAGGSPLMIVTQSAIGRVGMVKQLTGRLRAKLVGHFNYYGVIGNSQLLSDFFNAARHTIYRVLNNRSQKKSCSWEGFTGMWKTLDIPNPKIIETMQPSTPCLICKGTVR